MLTILSSGLKYLIIVNEYVASYVMIAGARVIWSETIFE